MQGWLVIPVSLAYLGVLFLIAWYGDRQTRWLANWRPWIYSLSIAVYCTSWTFYGTVGQASVNLSDEFKIILGARYTDTRVRGVYQRSAAPGTSPLFNLALGAPFAPLAYDLETSDSDLSYRLGVQYAPNPDLNFYAT